MLIRFIRSLFSTPASTQQAQPTTNHWNPNASDEPSTSTWDTEDEPYESPRFLAAEEDFGMPSASGTALAAFNWDDDRFTNDAAQWAADIDLFYTSSDIHATPTGPMFNVDGTPMLDNCIDIHGKAYGDSGHDWSSSHDASDSHDWGSNNDLCSSTDWSSNSDMCSSSDWSGCSMGGSDW
ncbi:MAG: hypothetical protein ACK5O3_16840 [Burkholderiales bacterium]